MNEQNNDVNLPISNQTILRELGCNPDEDESEDRKQCDFVDGQGRCKSGASA